MNEKADERVLNVAQLVVKWTLALSWPFEVCSADEWDVRGARLEHSHVHLMIGICTSCHWSNRTSWPS